MTERIYYSDAYCREFEATVIRAEARDGRFAVWLDRTAFYPTSGGQPFDVGTLDGETRILEVKDEDGEVVHLVGTTAPIEPGRRVRGTIDWVRRFDHMQQHTGQHVLSAAFVRSLGVPTVSFHMGAELSTIDLARDVSFTDIGKAEQLANQVVWDNRPVSISYAESTDAATLGLRKPSQRTGELRLVGIHDFDLSACGGSHVKGTGEIGMIAVTASERFKGGTRVEFACGGRALARWRLLRESATSAVKLLSVLPQEIPGAVERLQAELREQKRALALSHDEIAGFRAEQLAASAESFGSARAVFAVVDGDAQVLRALASTITRGSGMLTILIARSAPVLAIVARSRDLSYACDAIVRAGIEQFGGRGGGRPDMAQAGGLNASPEELLAYLRTTAGRS